MLEPFVVEFDDAELLVLFDAFVEFDELIWDENRPPYVINLCDSKDAKRFWEMVNNGDWKRNYYF